MSRRAILREKNKRAKEIIYPKGLNFHHDEVKDQMTIEGVVFNCEDFRQQRIGVIQKIKVDRTVIVDEPKKRGRKKK